jgi:hypothetical protein
MLTGKMPSQPEPSDEAHWRADQILYLALFGSQVIYGGLTFYMHSIALSQAAKHTNLAIPFVILALATAAVALFLDTTGFRSEQIDAWIAAAQEQSSEREAIVQATRQRAISLSVVRWAVAGMPSTIGLISVVLGVLPLSQALLLVALGALAHLACRPKLARVRDRINEVLPRSPREPRRPSDAR